MALKRSNEIKIAENVSELSFKPDEGEAAVIKRVEVSGAPANSFAEIYTGRAITGYFATNYQGYNHLAPVVSGESSVNLLDALNSKGKNFTYPVAEGETFTVKLPGNATFIKLVYDSYDAGDVSSEDVNGSKSKELNYLAYLTNANEWTSGDYYTLDKMLNPVEFPDFPVNDVPSKATITIHGVLGLALAVSVGNGTATLGTSYTNRFRIFYQRKVLFDPDRRGFLLKGNDTYSVTGTTKGYNYTQVANELPFIEDYQNKIKILEPELVFSAGEEANFQIGAVIDPDVSIEADKLILAAITTVRYE